jgi:hypothetical protein
MSFLQQSPLSRLFEACFNDDIQAMKILLNRVDDQSADPTHHYTLTNEQIAAKNQHIHKDKAQTDTQDFTPTMPEDSIDYCDKSLLHIAVINNSIPMINYLINDLNLAELIEDIDYKGFTPLMVATNMGHYDIMMTLVDLGANLDAASHYGQTLLSFAILSNNTKIMTYFLSVADCDELLEFAIKVMDILIQNNLVNAVKFLIETFSFDLVCKSKSLDDQSPLLLLAVCGDSIELFEYFNLFNVNSVEILDLLRQSVDFSSWSIFNHLMLKYTESFTPSDFVIDRPNEEHLGDFHHYNDEDDQDDDQNCADYNQGQLDNNNRNQQQTQQQSKSSPLLIVLIELVQNETVSLNTVVQVVQQCILEVGLVSLNNSIYNITFQCFYI